jgi:hypothetical protein
MKTRQRVLLSIALALIIALLATYGTAVAQATQTEIVGTSTTIGVIDPGVLTPLPGGNVKIRGMILVFQEEASDPRASGINTVVMNANWDSNWTGPMQGTWHVVNEYGTWEGTWTGTSIAGGSSIRGVAHGTGELEGLKYSIHCDYVGDVGACSGQILSPHGE